MLIEEVFVDCIISGGNGHMSMTFVDEMKEEFELHLIAEIKFFIGL